MNLDILSLAGDKMMISQCKTEEMVSRRPSQRRLYMFPSVNGIELVTSVKLLRVWMQDNLRADMHVDCMLSLCRLSVFVMKRLLDQGLPMKYLHSVFQAIIVTCTLYALNICLSQALLSLAH